MWTTLESGVQLAMISCGNIPLLGHFAALHNKSGTEHKKHKKRTQEAQEEQKKLQFEFPLVPLVFRSLDPARRRPIRRTCDLNREISPGDTFLRSMRSFFRRLPPDQSRLCLQSE